MARYQAGCAGQFMLHADSGGLAPLHHAGDDLDVAIVSCETGPVGCEVLDTVTGTWLGPSCWEEIDEAKARIAARVTS